MKKTLFLRRLVLLPAVAMALYAQAQITPVSLRIEHRPGDVLVDASLAKNTALQNESAQKPVPRFSWINKADAAAQAEKQKAYRICVATSVEALEAGEPDAWDSKKVKSPESYLIPYKGKPLKEGESYYWRVMTWNSKGKASQWSEVQKFSVGLSPESWKAKWIGAPWVGEEPQYSIKENKDVHDPSPVPMLRKAFEVKDGIKSAKAYVTGLGYFELYVNGTKPSDDVLVPDFTNYGPRPDLKHHPHISIDEKSSGFQVSYLLYDITNLLRSGKNAVGAMIGGGYYDSRGSIIGPFGSPRFICQIEITYNDGSRQTVVSDESWKAHESAIVTCDLYAGENYDARKEIPGWCEPSFDDSSWKNVALRNAPGGVLTAHDTPADKVMETFKPISFKKNDDGSYTVDFGEVISGWVHFKGVKGAEGQKLTIKYESEYPKEVSYTFKDSEPIDYTPKFSWQVFRTVTVKGAELTADMLTAEAVYTSMDVDCEFSSSNELFNKINKIWQRTEKDNIHSGVESDCPHREKIPYTGDGQAVCTTVMHNFDAAAFFRSWIATLRDAQDKETGYVPNAAPWCIMAGGGVPWGAAMVIMPWEHYLHYGDKQVLVENYDAAKRQIGYMLTWVTPEGIMHQKRANVRDGKEYYWLNLGDWVPAYEVPANEKVHTYTLWQCADRMSRMAKALGRTDDERKYRELADRTAKAFDKAFFNTAEASYGDYGCNLMGIVMGAADGKLDLMKQTLHKEIVEKYRSHVNTGYIGTGLFYETLAKMGMNNVAYDAMNQTDYPSFGNWIRQGATTFWEYYDGQSSHNHPFLGNALTWFYRTCAGVYADENDPGYRHLIIRPTLADKLERVHYAKQTPYGRASSEVSHNASTVTIKAEVPVGVHATIYIPSNSDEQPTVNGKKANKVKGVESVTRGEGCYILEVLQGKYEVQARK